MRRIVAFLLAVVVLVAKPSFAQGSTSALLSQLQQAIPACAAECFVETIPRFGCSLADTTCVCTNTDLAYALSECVLKTCTTEERQELEGFQSVICSNEDHTNSIRLVVWLFYALAASAILFRFVARLVILPGNGLWWDDWLALLTFVILTAYSAVTEVMIRRGVGKFGQTINSDRASGILFYSWVQSFVYTSVTVATKTSILMLYLRIFPASSSTWFRRICHTFNVILAMYLISILFALGFQCQPISHIWNPEMPGKCADGSSMIQAASALNISFDILIVFLPIPKILKLRISVERKVGISLVLLVGLFVTACSAVRLAHLIAFEAGSSNLTAEYTNVLIWSAIESCVGVVCACMPTMAGPIKMAWSRTLGSTISSLGRGSNFKRSQSHHESLALERIPSELDPVKTYHVNITGGQAAGRPSSWI